MLKRAAAAQAGLLGDVDECPVAGVLKQPVLADGGDEDVGKAVVVVIGDGHAHAVHLDGQAGALRHVGEGAVAIVAIEPQRAARAVCGPGQSMPLTSRMSSQPSPS